jgi:4-amino-4-deoxy-L-arabinose transferase-like glycosyltransferase
VVCAFLFLAGVQSVGLVGADEPRYAQVAREMMQRHEWVTPTLWGKPWLEKPPLYYWMTGIAYKAAGGVHDWAARLPSVVLTTLMVFFVYFWVRRFYRGMELDAALITAASAMVIGFSRGASMDMPLTATLTMAMLSWFAWYTQRKRVWLLPFYFFLALATLAKGPVAVFLAAVIIAIFVALRREWKLLLGSLWPPGVLLFLVVALPWYIAVQRANPDFVHQFIFQQNLARYTSDLYRHSQPFWYFLPVVLLGLVPWVAFVIAAVVDAVRDWRSSVEQPPGDADLQIFLAIWFLFPVIFFSFSRSKLPGYILPCIPAATILLADFIRRREEEEDKPPLWLILLHSGVSAALLIAAFIVPFKVLHLSLPKTVLIVAVLLAVCSLAFFTATLMSRGYRVLRFATLVPVVIAFAMVLRGTAPIIDALQSARPVQASLQVTALGQLPDIAVYDVSRGIEYGLGFYRNHFVANYGRSEIPDQTHVVVAASGTEKELEYRLPGRRVTRIGGWEPQHLDFYLVAAKHSEP